MQSLSTKSVSKNTEVSWRHCYSAMDFSASRAVRKQLARVLLRLRQVEE
ncbi:hypothetical protein MPTK1_2g16470 [Marchantia polymorpha subsp. ruderalis]|uniref:Uncharacterized protein n=1 Tax=Marchantia polymorpha TaxID=3197 RepID=A0A2R6W9Q7_MARPO|nr:hypothetical protein MARPO_0122s0017 [Marchantia polymorpha]BBN02585.1 hypothetical protein Mp_2g16470 [Marchantia polymorpha subsp. ruderalis]|eukprot:PTQ30584.1 hypothetical protein MARPO_0122s0017 [Marchantia polymorpha]